MAKTRKRDNTAIAAADPCTATWFDRSELEAKHAARDAFSGQWFVAHTSPGCEGVADRNLWRQGFVTFYPQVQVRRRRKMPNRDRYLVEQVLRPLFSRYIFVGLKAGQGLYTVNETSGISTVVYFDGAPLQVPQGVMDELMARTDSGGVVGSEDRVSRAPQFAPGQKVRMADNNPFAGLVAEISLDNGKEIMLWLDVLGGRRPLTVVPEAVGEILA
jgi:transcriptional antiterminator RfaH